MSIKRPEAHEVKLIPPFGVRQNGNSHAQYSVHVLYAQYTRTFFATRKVSLKIQWFFFRKQLWRPEIIRFANSFNLPEQHCRNLFPTTCGNYFQSVHLKQMIVLCLSASHERLTIYSNVLSLGCIWEGELLEIAPHIS